MERKYTFHSERIVSIVKFWENSAPPGLTFGALILSVHKRMPKSTVIMTFDISH